MILRKYASYDKETDVITMSRPIISPKAESESPPPSFVPFPFKLEFLCANGNQL